MRPAPNYCTETRNWHLSASTGTKKDERAHTTNKVTAAEIGFNMAFGAVLTFKKTPNITFEKKNIEIKCHFLFEFGP